MGNTPEPKIVPAEAKVVDPEGPVVDNPTEDLAPVKPIIGSKEPVEDEDKQVVRLEIPYRTIIRVVLSLLVIWLLVQVSDVVLLVFIAGIFTLALVPPTRMLEQRGLPRVAAAGIMFLVVLGLFAGFVWLIVPPLISQAQSIIENFPAYTRSLDRFVARYPIIDEQYREIRQDGLPENVPLPWNNLISATTGIVGGVLNLFFILVLTFYLLIEGVRAFPELTRVVSGYVIGQAINSTLFATFAYVLLTATGTPEPLLMAALAFILDAVPIAGAPLATIPAVVLAATVSPTTAIIVLVAYIIYQQVENYVLVPRVFGNTLQVSPLAILVGVLVGGQLLGVIGVILSLPITASIPVIERIWREDIPDKLTRDQI